MNRSASLIAAGALLALPLALGACAPIVGTNGFQAIDAKPTDIVAGTDTKETVLTRLGSPSTTSTFEGDWCGTTSARPPRNTPTTARR